MISHKWDRNVLTGFIVDSTPHSFLIMLGVKILYGVANFIPLILRHVGLCGHTVWEQIGSFKYICTYFSISCIFFLPAHHHGMPGFICWLVNGYSPPHGWSTPGSNFVLFPGGRDLYLHPCFCIGHGVLGSLLVICCKLDQCLLVWEGVSWGRWIVF